MSLVGARLVVVEGGPHAINWTHADKVNQELLDFLGQEQSAQAAYRSTQVAYAGEFYFTGVSGPAVRPARVAVVDVLGS